MFHLTNHAIQCPKHDQPREAKFTVQSNLSIQPISSSFILQQSDQSKCICIFNTWMNYFDEDTKNPTSSVSRNKEGDRRLTGQFQCLVSLPSDQSPLFSFANILLASEKSYKSQRTGHKEPSQSFK